MMFFKMMVDGASDEERPLVKTFLRHLLGGAGIGLLLGTVGYFAILLAMGNTSMRIPLLFGLAMLLQAAAVGGLVGAGVFMSRITDRTHNGDTLEPDHTANDKPIGD